LLVPLKCDTTISIDTFTHPRPPPPACEHQSTSKKKCFTSFMMMMTMICNTTQFIIIFDCLIIGAGEKEQEAWTATETLWKLAYHISLHSTDGDT
jgi:hypothetical protein